MRDFDIIVACTNDINGIGLNNSIPWNYSEDINFFKEKTTKTQDINKKNAIIMGRKTFESIGKELNNRYNIVITRNHIPNVKTFSTFKECILFLENLDIIENIFVIGGSELYKETIKKCRYIYMTKINKHYDCDKTFPNYDDFDLISFENIGLLKFCIYGKKHEEYQYINLIKEIFDDGIKKNDRTNIGTLSLFGRSMRFNLQKGFPLLTTKKVFWKGVVEELLWFLKGSTNSKELSDKNVKIWEGNTSREFLDKNKLYSYTEGDTGPIYGFQWRHFGAEYKNSETNYTNQGFDQIKYIIDKLKNNPNDRRILLSSWNPLDLDKMVLPPCHVLVQFYVSNGELSCQMYQRSCDIGLGIPFNIASYSLLTYMIAQVTNLKPKEFIHIMGDTHIYLNHIEALKQQIQNEPRKFPKLIMDKSIDDIDNFTSNSFKLEDYNPYKNIEMQMAV